MDYVFVCKKCGAVTHVLKQLERCPKCASPKLRQIDYISWVKAGSKVSA